MRERLSIYGWTIEVDREKTAQIHASMELGSAEACGCLDCKNWAAVRQSAYPNEILALFRKLGIQTDRETEMGSPLSLGNNRFLYNGWFHFVGKLLSGPSTREEVPSELFNSTGQGGRVERVIYHEVNLKFSIGFSEKTDLLPKEFKGEDVVQLEFTAEVPWVLKEPPSQKNEA